jgi:hypothetical protein
MKMRPGKIVLLHLVVVLIFGLLGASAAGAHSFGSDVNKQLAEVKQVTAKYHNVENAIADGYAEDPQEDNCIKNMGIHYVKESRLDMNVAHKEPEALVYEPMKNGKLKLVAVEYLTLGAERPSLFGQKFDDGPFPESYALHAWVWKNNPDGMFSAYNPKVTGCN